MTLTAGNEAFHTLVSEPEATLNLAAAALAMVADDYPDLDPETYLQQFDCLAEAVRSETPGAAPDAERVCEFLFQREGFIGNAGDFYDPRNSFLNEVLTRRLGIPITLSVVCLEVGWRLGLPLRGISFPGRFLVGSFDTPTPTVFDPFGGGARLSESAACGLLARAYGKSPVDRKLLRRHLTAACKKEILMRMLRNLKAIYAAAERHDKTLACIERLLILQPDEPREIRDRGLVLHKLDASTAARSDLLRYLQLAPRAAEAEQIRTLIARLESNPSRLN